MRARILLADDHPIVRSGLRQIIDKQPDLQVIAEVSDGAEAVARALQGDVDLAILDVAMPRLTGLQAVQQLSRRYPALRTLILSMYDNEQYFLAAVRAGASGYVLKSVVDEEIVEACRVVLRGGEYLQASTAGAIAGSRLESFRNGRRAADEELLTPRELEVLKLVAEGHSSQEIAELLTISLKTVERHRSNMLEKLGLHDRVGLTRYAIRRGLVEP